MPEIDYFQIKIEEIPGIFINLILNLNLAILKMRIAEPHVNNLNKSFFCDIIFMEKLELIKDKYEPLRYLLDERSRRLWGAGETRELGWGGVSLFAKATGLSRTTITTGIKEPNAISEGKAKAIGLEANKIRRSVGGRKSLEEKDRTLLQDLENLLDPVTRGDPECALRWTCKSTGKLATELNKQGHKIGASKVSGLLHNLGYNLQLNR